MALTLYEILENENIKADRFGMAAISYIFKAFGDNVRSKEYWPWGDKVDFPWNSDKNAYLVRDEGIRLSDLSYALACLYKAYEIYLKEEEFENKYEKSTNGLKKRIEELIKDIKNSHYGLLTGSKNELEEIMCGERAKMIRKQVPERCSSCCSIFDNQMMEVVRAQLALVSKLEDVEFYLTY